MSRKYRRRTEVLESVGHVRKFSAARTNLRMDREDGMYYNRDRGKSPNE
jgi:hypothetical protein